MEQETPNESANVRIHMITEDILEKLLVNRTEQDALKSRVLELESKVETLLEWNRPNPVV